MGLDQALVEPFEIPESTSVPQLCIVDWDGQRNGEDQMSKDVLRVPKANGAIIGADSFELAIQIKLLIPCLDYWP